MNRLIRRAATGAAAALIAVTAAIGLASPATALTTEQKLPFPVAGTKDSDTTAVTLGVKFTTAKPGKVVAVEFHRFDTQNTARAVQLWSSTGALLGSAQTANATLKGWNRATFATPVTVTAGQTFTASYLAPKGRYTALTGGFAAERTAGDLTAPVGAGVYKYGTAMQFPTSSFSNSDYYVTPVFVADDVPPPPPVACGDGLDNDNDTKVDFPADPGCSASTDTDEADAPPPPPGGWPDASNTGVPAGTTLTPYDGPCGIWTANVVIDSKTINCDLAIYQPGLIIRKSKVNGVVIVNAPTASVTVEDSEVDGGDGHIATIGDRNATVTRSNVHGGQHAVQCYGNCTVQDSWLHDTWPGGQSLGWHENAFISNGGTDMTVRHNTLYCTGGCTADLALIPDDNLSNVTVDNNLFQASPGSAYCFYGGGTDGAKPGTNDHIVVTNNVWQKGANGKCATYGPVTYMDMTRPGNVWTNNKWEDGATMDPVF